MRWCYSVYEWIHLLVSVGNCWGGCCLWSLINTLFLWCSFKLLFVSVNGSRRPLEDLQSPSNSVILFAGVGVVREETSTGQNNSLMPFQSCLIGTCGLVAKQCTLPSFHGECLEEVSDGVFLTGLWLSCVLHEGMWHLFPDTYESTTAMNGRGSSACSVCYLRTHAGCAF